MKLTAARWNKLDDENGDQIAEITSSPDMEKHQQKIIKAVNNTYGKGINPESVEPTQQALKDNHSDLKKLYADLYSELSTEGRQKFLYCINNCSNRKQEALNAAKIV
jgi:hypothetical protein